MSYTLLREIDITAFCPTNAPGTRCSISYYAQPNGTVHAMLKVTRSADEIASLQYNLKQLMRFDQLPTAERAEIVFGRFCSDEFCLSWKLVLAFIKANAPNENELRVG